MAAAVMNADVIVLDSDDDEMTSSSSDSSHNIYYPAAVQIPMTFVLKATTAPPPIKRKPNQSNGAVGHATATIVNEKPLDLNLVFPGFNNKSGGAAPESLRQSSNPVLNGLLGDEPKPQTNGDKAKQMIINQQFLPPNSNGHNFHQNDSYLDRKRLSVVVRKPIKKQRLQGQSDVNLNRKPQARTAHPYANITYYVSEPSYGFDTTNEDIHGQFRCTALNCNKLLSNNVSFMFHLWAHVATFLKREYSDDVSVLTDEKFLRTCDNCQSIFDTVHEKVKHYMEIHRGIFAIGASKFCHVCELYCVAVSPLQQHKAIHKSCELPFECRKCRFKTSSRQALVVHFAKVHIGTTFLMCPFCPYSTTVPQMERNCPIVFAKMFVQHMLNHGNVVARRCSRCSYKFIDRERFESHCKNHNIENHAFAVQTRPFDDLKQQAPRTKMCTEQLVRIKCRECHSQFLRAEEHFVETKKCRRCKFETNCPSSFFNHCYLSDCDPSNADRKFFYADPKGSQKKPSITKEQKRMLSVCLSTDFKQNFAPDRDFEFDHDRKPQLEFETDSESITRMVDDKVRSMITSKKFKKLGQRHQEMLKQNLLETENDENIKLIKKLRLPYTPLYEAFLEAKKKEDVIKIEW